ncbi:MAG: phage protein Gp36 family protein [Panacagrimonas sp.]
MAYLTPTQFVEGPGMLQELAEPFNLPLDLLTATLNAADRSAWSADEIAAADAALASITVTLVRADAEMDTYFARRGYTLPLSAVQFPVLCTWARNIARYHAQPQRDKTNEESGRIERDYRSTLRTLELVAAGKLSLGAGDPISAVAQAEAEDGAISICSEPRVFSRGTLRGL